MCTAGLYLLAAASAALVAAEPPGFVVWSAGELKSYSKTLAQKLSPQKVATQQLGQFGNHSAMIAHREGDGEAEVHEGMVDVFVVQTGSATLVVGGEVVGGRATGPGEIRGTSIQGGARRELGPGDVVHIPNNTPHQLLVKPGEKFTYMIVKVNVH